jgi:hypothetical protein
MKGERLGSHGLALLRQQLSERDLAAVSDVATLKLVSGRQLQALHFAPDRHASDVTAARTCRRVLERLLELRLLVRLERRVGGLRGGSSSSIYAIGPVGQRLVDPAGTRRRFREPTATFALHTLAIADLVVELRSAARGGLIEVLAVQAEPGCWRSLGGGAGNVLRPDLFVRLAAGEYEYHSFVEVDLGTEGLPRLLAKCQTYDSYFATGVEQDKHGLFPRVVWLLDNEQRAKRLHEAIERSTRLRPELFIIGQLPGALSALTDGAVNRGRAP